MKHKTSIDRHYLFLKLILLLLFSSLFLLSMAPLLLSLLYGLIPKCLCPFVSEFLKSVANPLPQPRVHYIHIFTDYILCACVQKTKQSEYLKLKNNSEISICLDWSSSFTIKCNFACLWCSVSDSTLKCFTFRLGQLQWLFGFFSGIRVEVKSVKADKFPVGFIQRENRMEGFEIRISNSKKVRYKKW